MEEDDEEEVWRREWDQNEYQNESCEECPAFFDRFVDCVWDEY